ncbi:MAG: hypothetical protein U0795_21430 [Pirellulales bacterium]
MLFLSTTANDRVQEFVFAHGSAPRRTIRGSESCREGIRLVKSLIRTIHFNWFALAVGVSVLISNISEIIVDGVRFELIGIPAWISLFRENIVSWGWPVPVYALSQQRPATVSNVAVATGINLVVAGILVVATLRATEYFSRELGWKVPIAMAGVIGVTALQPGAIIEINGFAEPNWPLTLQLLANLAIAISVACLAYPMVSWLGGSTSGTQRYQESTSIPTGTSWRALAVMAFVFLCMVVLTADRWSWDIGFWPGVMNAYFWRLVLTESWPFWYTAGAPNWIEAAVNWTVVLFILSGVYWFIRKHQSIPYFATILAFQAMIAFDLSPMKPNYDPFHDIESWSEATTWFPILEPAKHFILLATFGSSLYWLGRIESWCLRLRRAMEGRKDAVEG